MSFSSDDLFRMLDMRPEKEASAEVELKEIQVDVLPCGRTVLLTDEFDYDRSRTIARLLQINHVANPEDCAADFFAAAFREDLDVIARCPDANRQAFMEMVVESSDIAAMRHQTVGNVVASMEAAMSLATRFADDPKKMATSPLQASRAIKEAETAAEEVHNMSKAIGTTEGTQEQSNIESIQNAFNKVKNNSHLRRILNYAGRFRLCAQAKQRQKTIHGTDEMVGVELDGDVSRLLPVELSAMLDPNLEIDAMRRLIERQSLCRQFEGVEKQGQGPIVVCADESSSMFIDNSQPFVMAKAFALAMAWIARHQNRYIALVSFSSAMRRNVLVLAPGKWSQSEVINWLSEGLGGRTSSRVPLEYVPSELFKGMGAPRGKTDMIILTDGRLSVDYDREKRFLKWKEQEKVRLISLVLSQDQHDASEIARVSDETRMLNSIDVTEKGIQNAFSI